MENGPADDPTQAAPLEEEAAAEEQVPKKKKKKNKYSKHLKELQKLERGSTKAARRVAKAVSIGLRTWEARSERSAKKRKDGAFKDSVVNSTAAVGEAVRIASKAGVDFVEEVQPVLTKKRGKQLLKSLDPFS